MKRPERERVYIARLEKELELNFITLSDDKWLFDKYGDKADKLLRDMNLDFLLTVFWRLMSDDSKTIVSNVRIIEWDGMLEKEFSSKDPVERLRKIVSSGECLKIFSALCITRKKSDPEIDENTLKKKPVETP